MPVFTRLRDGVLVLTVDGDFTPNEVRRIARQAFEADDTPEVVPVLLDMSGAAGISEKSGEELEAMGATFLGSRQRISGLAIVAPSAFQGRLDPRGLFGPEVELPVSIHTTHADARAWLAHRS